MHSRDYEDKIDIIFINQFEDVSMLKLNIYTTVTCRLDKFGAEDRHTDTINILYYNSVQL